MKFLYSGPTSLSKSCSSLLNVHRATRANLSTVCQMIESKDMARVSVLAEIPDSPGALHEVLHYFSKYNVNLTHIESRPLVKDSDHFRIYINFTGNLGDSSVDQLLTALKQKYRNTLILDDRKVPWFPRILKELDIAASRTLSAGAELEADHPGFHDTVYLNRRRELADISKSYSIGNIIPKIEYSESEKETWRTVYTKLQDVHRQYACKEFLDIKDLMESECGFAAHNIPQAQDISDFLRRRTGFSLRPVSGLLDSRDFLNGLAFKVFFSTQYIRHHSRPLYTPEPDICHELLGHAPMFADPDFADFSQEIGLASLGASDDDIKKLSTCYWYSVEFGLLKERRITDGMESVKAYGAGLLSSFGELEYACKKYCLHQSSTTQKPQLRPWNPTKAAALTGYPITSYQPVYFVADSLASAKDKMRRYCDSLSRPFHARYNESTESIWIDRAVKVGAGETEN